MATDDCLAAQLQQLNERARWYSRQYWQISIAYVGTAGIALLQLDHVDTVKRLLPLTTLAIGIVGIFIIWHLKKVEENFSRCVRALINLEDNLGLRWFADDAKNATQTGGHEDHHEPLYFLVLLMTILSLCVSAYPILVRIGIFG